MGLVLTNSRGTAVSYDLVSLLKAQADHVYVTYDLVV